MRLLSTVVDSDSVQMLLHDLLSCSYLRHCIWSVITGRNSLQTVCLQWVTHTACDKSKPSRRCNRHGWTRTADGPTIASREMRHKHAVDLTCLSMDVRDCIRYQNALKHFIHLRSSSKRVQPFDSRRESQQTGTKTKSKYEAKLLIPQTLRTRAEL